MRFSRKLLTRAYSWQHRLRQRIVGERHRRREKAPPDSIPPDPARLLIVLDALLGDAVMCTPILAESRRLWPTARITLLCNEYNAGLFTACPLVDQIKISDVDPFTLFRRSAVVKVRDWMRLQRFDMGLIVSGNTWAPMMADMGIPIRVGVKGCPLEPCLTHSYDVGSPSAWGPPEVMGALRSLGRKSAGGRPQLWVDATARTSAQAILKELGTATEAGYVVLHPFGSELRQRWPAEGLESLSARLRQELGLAVVLIGTRSQGIPPAARNSAFIDARGRFTLGQLVAVVAGARLVISTDSGPFHMAGALGRPLLGLFRARRPEHARRYEYSTVLMHDHPDCRTQCEWDACARNPCRQMELIGVDEISKAAQVVLVKAAM